jgi:uncharacterized protein (DUF983 family)
VVAMLGARCPRCRKGRMFVYRAYSAKFQVMHPDCPHCGLHYEIETGFFWGAMYVTYAFTVALFIASFVAMQVLAPKANVMYTVALMLGLILGLLPLMARKSRAIFLYLFGGVRFRPELFAASDIEAKALSGNVATVV